MLSFFSASSSPPSLASPLSPSSPSSSSSSFFSRPIDSTLNIHFPELGTETKQFKALTCVVKERGVERGSARRSSLKGRERAIVSQTNIGTVSKATLIKLRDGVERIWAFPRRKLSEAGRSTIHPEFLVPYEACKVVFRPALRLTE